MEIDDLTEEMLVRANDIVLKLGKVFIEEGNKCNSTALMLFALTKFNAAILSTIQIQTGDKDQIDVFLKFVREEMEEMLEERGMDANKEEQRADDVLN